MNTHVRQLAALIDDLFDLTRLQAQELTWSIEQVEVRDLVHDAVEAMRPVGDAGSVQLRAHLNGSAARSPGNREQLSRVLFNLIQNAIHHTPPDGSVTVRSRSSTAAWRSRSPTPEPGSPPTSATESSSPSTAATRPASRRGRPGPCDLPCDRGSPRRRHLARGCARRHARALPAPLAARQSHHLDRRRRVSDPKSLAAQRPAGTAQKYAAGCRSSRARRRLPRPCSFVVEMKHFASAAGHSSLSRDAWCPTYRGHRETAGLRVA